LLLRQKLIIKYRNLITMALLRDKIILNATYFFNFTGMSTKTPVQEKETTFQFGGERSRKTNTSNIILV